MDVELSKIKHNQPANTTTNIHNALFANPKKPSAVVWATSTFIFLIPTCIELTPLGNHKRDAKGERDDAQKAYDKTQGELNAINAKIREAKQRILDLDCAMAGYQRFNQGVGAFQKSISDSNATPVERLRIFWQMHFDADKTESRQLPAVSKSWDEREYEWDYYYSCFWHSCGKDPKGKEIQCCYRVSDKCFGAFYQNIYLKLYRSVGHGSLRGCEALSRGNPALL